MLDIHFIAQLDPEKNREKIGNRDILEKLLFFNRHKYLLCEMNFEIALCINVFNAVDRLARADTFAVILSEETPRCGCFESNFQKSATNC